ncbi:hypothetical protein C6P40_004068 [Pichia californica]|uniref:RWD domain-containing protein n=1 Tax=Pichia californica TaxID=460514 RepID=A0A9P7BF17_9ASCO|nr:hypothetical protein C6P42_001102 [[Candida] californica]KAG0690017.1 hypothetical protein C6P40_004068 [[Candida] californica]
MDPLEEQQQELEILQSIYPDELTILTPTRFQINILLDTDTKRKHAVLLDVTYSENYPETVPILNIIEGTAYNEKNEDEEDKDEEEDEEENYDDDDDQTMSKKLLNLIETIKLDREDYAVLLRKIRDEAEDNVGMPSAFSLASSLKDHAETQFIEKFQIREKEILDAREAREREEQKKFTGTKVTPTSFEEWRLKFRQELGIDKRLDERYANVHKGRLTGKQIFEQGLASSEELEDSADGKEVDMNELKKKMEETAI